MSGKGNRMQLLKSGRETGHGSWSLKCRVFGLRKSHVRVNEHAAAGASYSTFHCLSRFRFVPGPERSVSASGRSLQSVPGMERTVNPDRSEWTRCGDLARFDHFNTHRNHALFDHTECACGGIREIDDPVFLPGTPVDDPNDDRTTVFQIRHADICAEGQGSMSSHHVVHIKDFPTGRAFTVEFRAIPGSESHHGSADRNEFRLMAGATDSEQKAQEADSDNPGT